MFKTCDLLWPESRKRLRDEEADLGNGALGFTEHRSKRLHSLPLRSSSMHHKRSPPVSLPPSHLPTTITPADSDSEETQQYAPCHAMDVDRDTDMTGSDTTGNSDGRIPTPMHPTFTAQVRGNNWGQPGRRVHVEHRRHNAVTTVESMTTGHAFSELPSSAQDPSVPRSLEGGEDWSMVQDRRLPSPISENDEEPPSSPGMILDSCSPALSRLSLERPPLPHLPHSTTLLSGPMQVSRQQADADMGMMDTDPTSSQPSDAPSPSSAPATPSPRTKFGHCRSKHTLNTWTIQPGMKKSFSIGYRADCDKCRAKVPGHFNHIIIS